MRVRLLAVAVLAMRLLVRRWRGWTRRSSARRLWRRRLRCGLCAIHPKRRQACGPSHKHRLRYGWPGGGVRGGGAQKRGVLVLALRWGQVAALCAHTRDQQALAHILKAPAHGHHAVAVIGRPRRLAALRPHDEAHRQVEPLVVPLRHCGRRSCAPCFSTGNALTSSLPSATNAT